MDGDGWLGEQKRRTSLQGPGERRERISRDGGEQAQGTAWAIPVSRSAKTAQRFSPRLRIRHAGRSHPRGKAAPFQDVGLVRGSLVQLRSGWRLQLVQVRVEFEDNQEREIDTEDTPCWARVSLSTVEFLVCLECLEFKRQV